jgi:hypothetical protein
MKNIIPTAVARRLILALLGYRCIDGVWSGPGSHLTDEQLDTLSERRWRAFIQAWLTSAASTN